MITLRTYQRQTLDDLYAWFQNNPEGHPICDVACGGGKSIIIASLCQEVLSQWPDQRILMAVASKELVEQNYLKLCAIWPEAPAGVYSASLNRKDCYDSIIFGTIGSIYNKALHIGRFDLVIVDECQNVNNKQSGMYRTLINDLQGFNPDVRIIGFTATPFRGTGVWLTGGPEPLFSAIAARVPMGDLLAQGYLAPLTVDRSTKQLIDTSAVGVDRARGDYKLNELAAASDQVEITRAAVKEIIKKGKDRKSWLVFCVNIEHAEHVLEEIRSCNITTELVTGKTPKRERENILQRYKSEQLRCVVNVGVLTTGFDAPATDLIALLRPTKSPVLYNQIAGRGMRIAPGKENCIWLDFTNTTAELGPVDQIKGRAWKPPANAAPTFKTCDHCGAQNPPGARICCECGEPFVFESKIEKTSSHASILSEFEDLTAYVFTHDIDRVEYSKHERKGKTPSLRVDYYSGISRVATEWVCLQHEGFAKRKSASWWQQRTELEIPENIDQALGWIEFYKIAEPATLTINTKPKFPEILNYGWNDNTEPATENRNTSYAAASNGHY